jgi:hypothetical protein
MVMFCAAALASLLQVLIDSSSTNILCSAIVMLSTGLLLLYLTWTDALEAHPLSTFCLVGFCITSQLGALLIQTAAWTPLIFLLYDPLYTFSMLAMFQAVALGTHALFRYFYDAERDRRSLLRSAIARLDIYQIPSARGLWIIGCIGLLSFSFANSEGIMARIADGANFLAWAPFLIPSLAFRLGPAFASQTRNFWPLAGYAAAIAGVAVLTNVRSTMFIGIVTVSLLFLLHVLRSPDRPRPAAAFKAAAAAAVLFVVMQPLTDFMIAMAVARDSRFELSPTQLLSETLYIVGNPALLERFRAQQETNVLSSYDEFYISNPMMAKVVETKFHDNAFHFGKLLTSEENRRRLWDVTIDTCLAGLPEPLLRLFRIDVDKKALVFSIGDFLVHLSKGRPLGGQKTGSQFAQGLVLFGVFYPLVYAGICFVMFHVCRLLSSPGPAGIASISTVAMTRIWEFFQHGITHDGLGHMFILVFRGVLEMILVYYVALRIAKLFLKDRYVFHERLADATHA